MIKPLSDNLLVKMVDNDPKENTTQSGIILGNTSKSKTQIGEVIATGKGRNIDGKIIPMEIKKGDKIILPEYGKTEFKYDDEDYVIVSENSVLAIIE